MIPALLAAHGVAGLLAPLAVRWLGRRVFLPLALVPAVAFLWTLGQLAPVLAGRELRSVTPWVPGLGLDLTFRLDALALVVAAVVTGVGALVVVYCAAYFDDDEPGLGRLAGVLVAFAGSMLGLVLADNVFLLYVFWELTTVCSYLLIGHGHRSREARVSAQQALLLTTAGGLLMLLGFVALGQEAGTYELSAILANAPTGGLVPVALVLVLIGAFTKSAQAPFHPWLPRAMAAPTPVSAYLHAAAMVKAGIYLVARLAPAFADVPPWRPLVLTVGLVTMLLGGWRALRQTDLKLLLAYSTISQLGFLTVLFGAGTRTAALAGEAMLVAHALSKSALFLAVGTVEHSTGTRDLRELSGLARRLPLLLAATALAAASLAGVPPMLGFVGKEAAYEAFLPAPAVLTGVVAGSVLTAAYALILVAGPFGPRRGRDPTPVHHPPGAGLVVPVAVLAVMGVALGPPLRGLDRVATAYAQAYGDGAYHLQLWHGFTGPLALSLVTLALGAAVYALRGPLARLQAALPHLGDADRAYWRTLGALDRLAVAVTARTQTGSLPRYLTVVLLAVLAVPGARLVVALVTGDAPVGPLRAWDSPVQLVLGVLVVAAAVATIRAHRRFTAVLFVGTVGYGVAALFVVHGAPDLALTQFLVESLTLVVFVLVLRHLPETFPRRPVSTGWLRPAVALASAALVTTGTLVVSAARTAPPVSRAHLERSLPDAGATNVVNALLVDFRAFDTLGEIAVLAVAATGVVSLVLLDRRTGRPPRPEDDA